MGSTLSKADLKRLAHRWKATQLDTLHNDKARARPITPSAHADKLTSLELVLVELRERFALNRYEPLTEQAQTLLEDIPHESEDIQQLNFELAKAQISCLEEEIALLKGRPSAESVMATSQHPAEPDTQAQDATSISDAFELYRREKSKNQNWNGKTEQEQVFSVSVLQSLLCNKAVAHITKADIRDFKAKLARLPKNITKDKRFAGLSFLEIIDNGISEDYISTTRANQHLRVASSFLGWCQQNGYLAENPVTGMIPKQNRNAREDRKPFSDTDIQTILTHPQVATCSDKKPHQYWVPRLAMHTGARLEELCQLHTEDILEVDGIHCISINESRPDQNLKNLHSTRCLPLHPTLLSEGFLDYVQQRHNQAADGLLFPELNPQAGKYSHNVSKWFGRVVRKLELEEKKSFHSYRHTMADKLRSLQAPDYVIMRIMGHSTQSETHDRYGSNQDMRLFSEVINQISFQSDRS